MKLLFYRYGSICEPDIIDAFQELGHEIYEVTEQITNKEISSQDVIKNLTETLFTHPVDFVFSINFFPMISEVCNIFHLRYLSWTVDAPVMELYSTSITNPWNRTFLFDRAQYNDFYHLNPDCIFHLPLAANIKEKQKLFESCTESDIAKFSHDIAFVGSLYTEKCPYDRLQNPPAYLSGYLNGIMASQMKVYGYYFIEELLSDQVVADFKDHFPGFYGYPAESYLTDKTTLAQLYIGNKISALERTSTMQNLSKQFTVDIYTGSNTSDIPALVNHGFAKTLTEMPLIFHYSKLNLNISSKAIRTGLPLRIWDILSCGGFVLTNYQEEIATYFTQGEDLSVYGSMEELVDQIHYYLSHPAERAAVAENGYRKLCASHTYTIRLSQMLDLAFAH